MTSIVKGHMKLGGCMLYISFAIADARCLPCILRFYDNFDAAIRFFGKLQLRTSVALPNPTNVTEIIDTSGY